MEYKLYFIKDGRQYMLRDGQPEQLPDGILDGCIRRTAERARRKAWKTSGEGAKFTGAFEPGADEESQICQIRARVHGMGEYAGTIYFAEQIDEVSGIYKKANAYDTTEAIACSSNHCSYLGLDIHAGQLAVPIALAGEVHIAVSTLPSTELDTVTEGHSVDLDPAWSKTEPGVVYFSSAGLAEQIGDRTPERPAIMTPAAMMSVLSGPAAPIEKGPSAICRLNTRTQAFDVVLEDEQFDFAKPRSGWDGSLYYIKKPYGAKAEGNPTGCLTDLVLFPIRLIGALFNFLSFFSIKYAGKPLSSGGTKAKRRDDGKIWLDGNLINAEAELKANANDPFPGIMPKSAELWRMDKQGHHTRIRGGVLCYTLDPDGQIVYSNGKYILRIKADGSEEKLAAADGVTYLTYMTV